ncbi:MAG: hypothetical protein HUK08_05630 [Bacteroidaceae bacterium]|nr:hypothetical protein [Bacteroidaceae bacterium]
MKNLFWVLFASLFCLTASAQGKAQTEARVKEIRAAYADAKKKMDAAEKSIEKRNKTDITMCDNYAFGRQEKHVEFFYDILDDEMDNDFRRHGKQVYFIRVKSNSNTLNGSGTTYEEYLVDDTGNLMFHYCKTTDDGRAGDESRHYLDNKGNCNAIREIANGKTTDKPRNIPSLKEDFDKYKSLFVNVVEMPNLLR